MLKGIFPTDQAVLEIQNDKILKDFIALLMVVHSGLQWCYEVCKSLDSFERTVVDLEKDKRTRLSNKFKDAKQHLEYFKCGKPLY